ncbi:homoserine kinase [Egicoccus sp. AB-alg6-2]|uniref:homoserine kinase n=1 Tax=Egicoccus sp. AB-alg6-2 TaxID=3242692 RepID=UPI00359EEA7C
MTDVRHATVRVPATSANLGPGFDAFGLALSRYLVVRSHPRSASADRVATRGDGAGEVATGDDNLLWRSVVAFCDTYDAPTPDVHLEVVNDIPLERGLGSSSSAIVAGLVMARALTGVVVGDRHLVELADRLEGHPDNVAPALLGGLVACALGDDGRLVVRRVNPAPHLRPVVLVPTTRQATTAARAVLPACLPREDVAVQAGRAGHVLGALVGAWPADATASGDRLHEPARLQVMGATGAVVAGMRALGIHAWLSGAGPSAAAMLADGPDGERDEVQRLADTHGFDVRDLRVDLGGAVACLDGGCAFSGTAETCAQCPRQRI